MLKYGYVSADNEVILMVMVVKIVVVFVTEMSVEIWLCVILI